MTATDPTTTPQARATSARPATIAWLVLSAITIGSWWLAPGHSGHTTGPSVPITLAVVLLGAIKGRLIIRYFMDVRHAPRWLRTATDAWLAVLWIGVLIAYLAGR